MTAHRSHIVSHFFVRTCFSLLLLLLVCAVQAQEEEPATDTVVAPAIDSVAYYNDSTATEESADDEEMNDYALVPKDQTGTDSAVLRQVPDTAVKRLQALREFEYANDPEYWVKAKKEPPKERRGKSFWEAFYDFFDASAVKLIFYTIVIIVLLIAIYRIVVVNKLYMSFSSKALPDEAEDAHADMDNNTLEQAISNAVQRGEYRQAVRYLYIRSLRTLNDRGWIRYHAQATNYDYLQQMQGKPLLPEFRFLTQVYDYVWYGEFALEAEQFTQVHQRFNQFFTQVK